jgi:hypothetical protein
VTDLRTEPKLRLFADLPTGYRISFGPGKFDEWLIYFVSHSNVTYFPKDVEYFSTLDSVGQVYGHMNLYRDFLTLYNWIGTEEVAKPEVIEWICAMAGGYGKYRNRIINVFSILYAGMVAEEKKEHKVLGKKIKRLGIYQVLIDREQPAFAAHFSRGMKAAQLKVECEKRGF